MYIPQSKFEYESNIQVYNIPNTLSLLKLFIFGEYRHNQIQIEAKKNIFLLNNAFLELSSLLIQHLISVFFPELTYINITHIFKKANQHTLI